MSTDFPKEYLDPLYWNPENKGFEIIDWERWYATEPKVPSVFDPPQRKNLGGCLLAPMYWWNRSCYFQPLAAILHSCCTCKPEMDRISKGDSLFKKMLIPEHASPDAPEELRNHLYWTENNIAPETLIGFGSWAFRKQTEEGRVIGVGDISINFTNDPTCWGYIFAINSQRTKALVQRSPDGKWISLQTIDSPSAKGTKCNYLFIYVVQEGDEFRTVEGEPMDYVKPGDIVRVTWDESNPYETDNSKLKYLYFPRKVASINENGEVVLNDSHYEALLKNATNDASDMCCKTCCFTCALCMSAEERFQFQVGNISDLQVFKPSKAAPPTSEEIDRAVGDGEDDFNDNPKS